MTGGGGVCGAGYVSLWFNNLPPAAPAAGTVIFVPLNTPMTPFPLSCVDPESDTVTVTSNDALPPNLSIISNNLTGTAVARGTYGPLNFRCTDITGDFTNWQ